MSLFIRPLVLLEAVPRGCFEKLAKRHSAGRKKRELSAWGHLLAMVFAQTGGARSLRDLERLFERHAGVGAHPGLGEVKRPTLADASRISHFPGTSRNAAAIRKTTKPALAGADKCLTGQQRDKPGNDYENV